MRARRPLCVAALLAICAGGCSTGDEDPAGELPAWPHRTGEVELRLGEVDGALLFGTIQSLEFGPGGYLYVTERERHDIRVLSPEGEVVRIIGREGQGPGEFQYRPGIVEWIGDTLVAAAGTRLSRFDGPSGAFLGSESWNPRIHPSEVPIQGLLDRPFAGGYFAARGAVREGVGVRYYWAPGEGRILDTLVVYPPRERVHLGHPGCDPAPVMPFQPMPVWGWDGRRLTIVTVEFLRDPHRMVVVRRAFAGDTIFRATVPHLPVPFDEGLVERRVESLADYFHQRCGSLPMAHARRLVRRALEVPDEERPTRGGILNPPDHGAWIELRAEALGLPVPTDGEPAPSFWLVIERNGTVASVVELPPRFAPHVLDDPLVWGVLRDELGVNYIARVRLEEE